MCTSIVVDIRCQDYAKEASKRAQKMVKKKNVGIVAVDFSFGQCFRVCYYKGLFPACGEWNSKERGKESIERGSGV